MSASDKDNIPFLAFMPKYPSNSQILRLDNEQNNSYALRNDSLFNEFSLINDMEEFKYKDDSDFCKKNLIISDKDEENEKENVKELLLEKSNDDTKRKDIIEENNSISLIHKDKILLVNGNSKKHQELIKEKDIESINNGPTKITNEQTKLLEGEEEIHEKNEPSKFLKKKKKRGQKIKKPKKNAKVNDMFSEYNLSRKCKCHFSNYCVSISNDFAEPFRKEQNNGANKFIKLNKKFKTTVSEEADNFLKNATLGDIINTDISHKFKNFALSHNHKIYDEEVQQNEILKEIFSIKYESLFRIYYQSNHIINLKKCNLNEEILKKYGLDKDIKLNNNVKMLDDLLENNSTMKDFISQNNYSLAKKYKNDLRNCIIKKYKPKALFLIHEDCK